MAARGCAPKAGGGGDVGSRGGSVEGRRRKLIPHFVLI